MSEERVNSLLLVWQEHHLQGHDLTPADLCRDCPELAPELEQRIQVLHHLSMLMQLHRTRATAPIKGQVKQRLRDWETNADLPCLHDQDALDRLPEDERKA
jgi:hypothetical protein